MIRRTLAVVLPLALLVACSSPSGSGQESQGGGGGESAAASTAESAAESAVASTGGGGGSATTACDLITAAEVATVMGVASTEAESVTGGTTSYCNYRSDGTLVAATSFGTQDAEVVFGAWESDGPAVSGIGDKAVYSNSSATLYFVSGSSIMGITAGGQDPAEQLGVIAADRL